jgi:L-malate glycosyltransferase
MHMRLLMVAEASTIHTHKWAVHFTQLGAEVLVVSSTPGQIDGVRVVRFPQPGVWWARLPRVKFGGGWPRWIAGWLDWRQIVRRFNPDLVHVYFARGEVRDYFYYRKTRPLVVSTLGSDVVFNEYHTSSKAAARRISSLLSQADAVTATTRFLADETRKYMTSERPIEIIPFGVDCSRFAPSRRQLERRGIRLGFVKHLETIYGPEVLLDALLLIRQRCPDVTLAMVGAGSQEGALRSKAESLGLAPSVEFLGRVPNSDVPAILQNLDIVVMPSICHESFGVAALEASACGLPVVASRVGGIPEAVVDGVTGVLVPPGDAASLADACVRLIQDPAERRRMGDAGRRQVLERFDWQRTAAGMTDLYTSLLTSSR